MSDSPHILPKDRLQVFLLGVPLVLRDGQPVSIPRRHVRGLLYHLAAQRQPVSRAHLCLLFWPDLPEANTRRNLTRLLTHLRMALPTPSLLEAGEEQVNMDSEMVWCDVSEFRRLSALGQADIEGLEAAVHLYRESFLSGFDLPDCPDFERWATNERSALESQYLGNLSQLLGMYASRQDYPKAIACAQQYLAIDELAEEVHRRLIMVYALAGYRSKALRQFETCVSVLEQQLGTDPLPETRAIYQAVLDERLLAYPPEAVENIRPAWMHGLRLDIPLVGRSAPLSTLNEAFQRAKAGQSSVILLSGEPGIGKSRLLHDFMKACQGSSLVLYGAGQRGEQSVSYHPIVEALRPQLVASPMSLPLYWLAEISRLFPELANLYPQLPRPLSFKGEEARIRLFEALSQCISNLQTVSGPLLLCLDDLHWFDPTSLNWLVYLARQLLTRNCRVMVIGTYRNEDVGKIKELKDGLDRLGLGKEIRLGGLETVGIRDIIHYLFNHRAVGDDFVIRLRDATGGNPFYVLEMLRTLSEESENFGELNHWVDFPLPDSVREAIDRRLDRLNPKSRQVLEAGAVIGPAFDFQTVRITGGRNEFETMDGLADLVQRQLILEKMKSYHFCHDLVYRTSLTSISPMRLQLLHSRAARAFEKLHPDSLTALAYHYEAAGDLDKALICYQRAASQAEELFAWQEAVDFDERLLQILDELDPGFSLPQCLAQRTEILKELARFNHLLNRLVERDKNLERLESLAIQCRDQGIELEALALRAYYLHQDGFYKETVNLVEKGLILADRRQDDAIRCHLLAQMGFSLQFLGQPDRALSTLESAFEIADKKGDIEMRGQILSRMGFIYSLFGHYRKALDCQRESYTCYQQLNDPYTAARNLPQIGHLLTNLGQFDEAWQALVDIQTLAKKAGARTDEAHAFMGLGGYHLCKGEYFLALGYFDQALSGFQTTRALHLIASSQASMGMVFYHLGNLPQARASLESALQTARTIGHRMRIAQALVQLSLVEIADHTFTSAREHVLEGIKLATATRSEEDLSAGLAARARLERIEGYLDLSKNLALEAIAETQDLDLAPLEVFARTEAGLALLAAGNVEQAYAYIQPAVLTAGTVHQRWQGTEEVYLASAKILQTLGHSDVADEQQRQAGAIIKMKADAIPEPGMRQIFLKKFPHTLIHSL